MTLRGVVVTRPPRETPRPRQIQGGGEGVAGRF